MADILEKNGNDYFKEAVCVNASRVYDSCSDKDCLEDLRVHFTSNVQNIINSAVSVKCKEVKILNVLVDVEAVPFNNGYYTIDLNYFFLVELDAYCSVSAPPIKCEGLATFNKKVILYGSEGKVYTYTSEDECKTITPFCEDPSTPKAVLQIANPIALGIKLVDYCDIASQQQLVGVPETITSKFEGSFDSCAPEKAVLISIGIFSIVSLQRDVSMLVPVYDFCIPNRECVPNHPTDDPCELFKRIKFPTDEFFPPKAEDNIDC